MKYTSRLSKAGPFGVRGAKKNTSGGNKNPKKYIKNDTCPKLPNEWGQRIFLDKMPNKEKKRWINWEMDYLLGLLQEPFRQLNLQDIALHSIVAAQPMNKEGLWYVKTFSAGAGVGEKFYLSLSGAEEKYQCQLIEGEVYSDDLSADREAIANELSYQPFDRGTTSFLFNYKDLDKLHTFRLCFDNSKADITSLWSSFFTSYVEPMLFVVSQVRAKEGVRHISFESIGEEFNPLLNKVTKIKMSFEYGGQEHTLDNIRLRFNPHGRNTTMAADEHIFSNGNFIIFHHLEDLINEKLNPPKILLNPPGYFEAEGGIFSISPPHDKDGVDAPTASYQKVF